MTLVAFRLGYVMPFMDSWEIKGVAVSAQMRNRNALERAESVHTIPRYAIAIRPPVAQSSPFNKAKDPFFFFLHFPQ